MNTHRATDEHVSAHPNVKRQRGKVHVAFNVRKNGHPGTMGRTSMCGMGTWCRMQSL